MGTNGTSRNVTIDLGTLVSLNETVAASGYDRGGLMESVLQSALAVAARIDARAHGS